MTQETTPLVTDEQIKHDAFGHCYDPVEDSHNIGDWESGAKCVRDIYEKEIRRLKAEKCVHCHRNDPTS